MYHFGFLLNQNKISFVGKRIQKNSSTKTLSTQGARQQAVDIKKHLQPTFQFIRSLLASLLTQIKEQTSKFLAKYFISDTMPFKDTLQMLQFHHW